MKRAIIIAALLAIGAAHADMEWETAISQKEQVTKGLVAYWAMRNDDTTVYDEFGSINVTAVNSPAFGTQYAAVGYGARFDGVNDYVSVSSAVLSGTMSVSVWIYPTTVAGSYVINNRDTDTKNRYYLALNADGTIGYGWRFDDSKVDDNRGWISAATAGITANNWYHIVAITRTGTAQAFELWVNGGQTHTANKTCAVGTIETPAYIGIFSNLSTGKFAGNIDEMRIYNRALTADEVKQLYRMGAIPKGIK